MKIYTFDEAADYLDVHPQTIEEFVKHDRLNFFRFGKDRMFTESDLDSIKLAIRSRLPSISILADAFDVSYDAMYYYFRVKYKLAQDAMNQKEFCYGEKKIRYLFASEGWIHPGFSLLDPQIGLGLVISVGDRGSICWARIKLEGLSVKMEHTDKNRRNLDFQRLYTAPEMSAMLDISRRTLDNWLGSGKIKPSGKSPKGEPLWNESDAEDAVERLHSFGWTMGEMIFIFGISYGLVNHIVNNRFSLSPIGMRNRSRVYDPEEVRNVMKKSGRDVESVRIMRIDGGIRPEDQGWFVVELNEEEKSLSVVSDELVTLSEAEKLAEETKLQRAQQV